MRPIWFDRPYDEESYNQKWEETEYMIGPSILIAPVLIEGAISREVNNIHYCILFYL